ncbi:hypothetical protein BGZ61DRAFT_28352 [Ilyonectria robusta]|uniref:uncharacterized protein n=1 Tax=Ilyonectria robusta TaxID=1079257 RepID=UPI001E8DFDC4|nr:uncharacterized protein BGZ61DRAFT_28352 [Ilyonectria robusta]KAH8738123.1 hypothetical protein BGZ61DRAFT_28352 [Ilyonectria robusta]
MSQNAAQLVAVGKPSGVGHRARDKGKEATTKRSVERRYRARRTGTEERQSVPRSAWARLKDQTRNLTRSGNSSAGWVVCHRKWSRAGQGPRGRAWRMGQESRASPSRGVMQWGGEVENDADSDDGVGEITLGAGWILDDTKHRALMLRWHPLRCVVYRHHFISLFGTK